MKMGLQVLADFPSCWAEAWAALPVWPLHGAGAPPHPDPAAEFHRTLAVPATIAAGVCTRSFVPFSLAREHGLCQTAGVLSLDMSLSHV